VNRDSTRIAFNMSYAQAAARGPKQSPEEARAPALPQIAHEDEPISSTVDVDSPHVSSVPSDYHGETSTQATRREHEAEDAEREEEREEEREAESEAAAEKRFKESEKKAADEYKKAKAETSKKSKEVKGKAKEFGKEVDENKENPVVVGNAVVVGLGTALLGFGAYRKYSAGELSWKVAGAWGGIIGLFCVGDYYLSQWLFKNKYPRK